jgi:hypothetical protein
VAFRRGQLHAVKPHLLAAPCTFSGHLAQALGIEGLLLADPPENHPSGCAPGGLVERDFLVFGCLELRDGARPFHERRNHRIGVQRLVFANGDEEGLDRPALEIDADEMEHAEPRGRVRVRLSGAGAFGRCGRPMRRRGQPDVYRKEGRRLSIVKPPYGRVHGRDRFFSSLIHC